MFAAIHPLHPWVLLTPGMTLSFTHKTPKQRIQEPVSLRGKTEIV